MLTELESMILTVLKKSNKPLRIGQIVDALMLLKVDKKYSNYHSFHANTVFVVNNMLKKRLIVNTTPNKKHFRLYGVNSAHTEFQSINDHIINPRLLRIWRESW